MPQSGVWFGVSRGLHPHFLGDIGVPSQHPLEEWTGGGAAEYQPDVLTEGRGSPGQLTAL